MQYGKLQSLWVDRTTFGLRCSAFLATAGLTGLFDYEYDHEQEPVTLGAYGARTRNLRRDRAAL